MHFLPRSASEKFWLVIIGIILIIVALATLIPFLYIISTSLSPTDVVLRRGMMIVPYKGISFDAFSFILNKSSGIPRSYLITIYITVVGTTLSLAVTSAMAYGLSKNYLPGRKTMTFLIVFTILFSGGLIPTYVIVKYTGLINKLWAMIIPGLVSAWYVIIMISFFKSIPESIEESARIDGCSDISIFFRIIIPLSLPAMFTIGLFYAVAYWNSWFPAIIYLNDSKKWPLQVLLRQVIYFSEYSDIDKDVFNVLPPPSNSVKTATIVVTALPIMLVYPFIQKTFCERHYDWCS